MSAFKEFKKIINRILWGMPNRYGHLVKEVRRNRCHTIMEIGVWNGDRSKRMIQAALESDIPPTLIRYYGFDLFESADESVISKEASKFPPSMELVKKKLQSFIDMGVNINLYKGDTTKILPELVPVLPSMDFVFIDGGHSYDTVRSDWECVQHIIGECSVVIFDDYVNEAGIINMNFGVNKLVDSIDKRSYSVFLLRPVDSFRKEWGTLEVRFVKIIPKKGD